jgi:hypothetical protein
MLPAEEYDAPYSVDHVLRVYRDNVVCCCGVGPIIELRTRRPDSRSDSVFAHVHCLAWPGMRARS